MMRLLSIKRATPALMIVLAVLLALPAAAPSAAQGPCAGSPPARLTAGQQARVVISNGVGNNLRASPSSAANVTILGVMPDGEIMSVLSGPQCADNLNWWQIRRANGQTGWTVEGQGTEYWVEPWPVMGGQLAQGKALPATAGQIAFLSGVNETARQLYLMAADGSRLTPLMLNPAPFVGGIAWSPDGQRLVFSAGMEQGRGELYVVIYDGTTQTWGQPRLLVAQAAQPKWSPNGQQLAYTGTGPNTTTTDIFVINADGSSPRNLTNSANVSDRDPAWSPDGTRIAFVSDPGTPPDTTQQEIFVIGPDGNGLRQLTDDTTADWLPVWSPDGRQIAFYTGRANQPELFIMQADGTLPTRLTQTGLVNRYLNEMPPVFSPDGKRIAFVSAPANNAAQSDFTQLFTVTTGGADLLQYTADNASALWPSWSPDGAYLAFTSNRNGNFDLYAIRADGVGLVNLTNSPAALESNPAWAPATAALAPGTATATPSAPSGTPGQAELLLIYDPAVPVFTLKNTAGTTINLAPLSFQGAGITVPATVWQTQFLASPLDNFQAGGCLMLWRYGLPEQSAPPECGSARQGWVADEQNVFWNQGSFTVLYNGAPVATCDSNAKQCVVDLP